MALLSERVSDYNSKIDFSYYDQITRKNKAYPLNKKITFKHGMLAIDMYFDGVMLSNDADYTEPL